MKLLRYQFFHIVNHFSVTMLQTTSVEILRFFFYILIILFLSEKSEKILLEKLFQ
jgi:hypothetical protein